MIEKDVNDKIKTYGSTDNQEQLLLKFSDNIVDEQGEIIGTPSGKGAIDSQISVHLFSFLESYHIPTHFIKAVSETEILVKNLESIPFKIVMRNSANGEIIQKLKIDSGISLKSPILEYFVKDIENKDLMINSWHAVALGYVTNEEIRSIERMASKINALLKSFFLRRELKLSDFDLQFGRFNNKIFLADVLSLDTIRLLDVNTNFRYDQSIFKKTPSEAISLYENLLKRIIGEIQ